MVSRLSLKQEIAGPSPAPATRRAEYQQKNRLRINAAHRAWRARTVRERKKQAYDILGRQCVRCGFSDERALQIDHVAGGGCARRKHNRSIEYVYLDVIAKRGHGYQVLCANCNWIKRSENHE